MMKLHSNSTADRIIKWGAVVTAAAAILTAMGALGIRPVTSGELKNLDRKQAEVAVEVYRNKVRSLMLLPPQTDPTRKQIWQEFLDEAKREQQRAEERRIELSK